MNVRHLAIVSATATALLLHSCGTSNMFKGTAIGAGAGGVIGGVIGKKAGNTAAGAIIGAALGGGAGAAIGRYMDKQAEELQAALKNARIERVGEGIKITFDSGILFDVNSESLRDEAKDNINDLGKVLQKYEDTNLLVVGHTDSTGSEQYNQQLSERRANSVSMYLSSIGVNGARINAMGKGEEDPVADNSTKMGRQENRRVELAIFANEKLIQDAKKGDIEI